MLCLTNRDHIKCFMLFEFLPSHVVLDMIIELVMSVFYYMLIDSLVILNLFTLLKDQSKISCLLNIH